MALLAPARSACIRTNENELSIDGGSDIDSSKIHNKIVNLLSFTKKISSKADFLTSKASLAFIQLRKIFTKALILHYFNSECHI